MFLAESISKGAAPSTSSKTVKMREQRAAHRTHLREQTLLEGKSASASSMERSLAGQRADFSVHIGSLRCLEAGPAISALSSESRVSRTLAASYGAASDPLRSSASTSTAGAVGSDCADAAPGSG